MENIKCSVITVSYNSALTIENTIRSVLDQTYENIEYIIVDAASTDGTVEIIKKYEPCFNGRLKWISEPDDGIYYGMNKGIEMATGDVIGIINSDDQYTPNAVATICEIFGTEKYQIIYGAMDIYSGGQFIRSSFVSHEELPDKPINHPSCFVSRLVYSDFGKYNTRYSSVADFEFLARMSGNKEVIFKPVNEVLAVFNKGGMSGSDKAYMDLLMYQRDVGKISGLKYLFHKLLYFLVNIKRKVF